MNKRSAVPAKTHLVFIKGPHLDAILAGRKRFELRMSFRDLACAGVSRGDVLLLKRTGGEVEAACDVGDVLLYRDQPPDRVAGLVRPYADVTAARYVERYVPPRNSDRLVNLVIVELVNVHGASLPAEWTPRGVRSGWVADFGGAHATHEEPLCAAVSERCQG